MFVLCSGLNIPSKGILRPEELAQEGRLEAAVSREYRIVTRDGKHHDLPLIHTTHSNW